MKPARLAVLGIAIVAGLGAALMMGGRKDPPPPVTVAPAPVARNTVDVLVAATDLGMGQRLQASDLRWLPWPADAVPSGLITRRDVPEGIAESVGSIARQAFLANEPIRREKLIKADGSGFMSAILPPGMRAVAITIDNTGANTAGNFVLPNDRVDVIRTYRDEDASRSGGGDVHQSEIILTNIRVLAIGQNVQEKNGERVVTGSTATLEATPAQAELLTLAQKVGQLSLVLRSLADANQTEAPQDDRDTSLTIVRFGVPKQTPRK
jgi:pilus assembly protein CpaB